MSPVTRLTYACPAFGLRSNLIQPGGAFCLDLHANTPLCTWLVMFSMYHWLFSFRTIGLYLARET